MKKLYITKVILVTIILLLAVAISYGGYTLINKINRAKAEIQLLDSNLASTTEILSKTQEERDLIFEQFESEKKRNDDLEGRLEEAEDVLGIIVKRQTTDPELLQKYSKVYFLNEHYRPKKMVKIDEKWVVEGRAEQYLHELVWPFLEKMFKEAEDDGIDLRAISSFRSFDEQSSLKNQYTTVYGSGANKFSADQGYSEHQLGTTVDLSTAELAGSFTSIDQTESFAWLESNAYKYGFTLSYPKNNDYYQYEPWHWRFVGRDLARYLHRNNKNFYDLDQRDIDEYIVEFFD